MIIPLGEWTPDQPIVARGNLRTAKNVVPALASYDPLNDLAESSEALTERPIGGVSVRDIASGTHIYAGTATTLQELASDATWTDRSKVGGYAGGDTTRWRFTQYGDRMIATNATDAIQFIDMSSGTAFDDLSGTPPNARYVATINEFVVLGAIASSAMAIRWSALGDSETWTIGVNQADEQQFADGGEVTGLAASDALYVFQEQCIRRAYYVGPPLIFQIDVIERQRGCIAPGSLAQLGVMTFFLAEDGFYVFNGGAATPIGHEKVDEWFKADAARAHYDRMTATIDPLHKLYMVSYASSNSMDGTPDSLLIYNWAVNRWAYARTTVEALLATLTLGYTLETLDAVFGDLDSIPYSLDDPILSGGSLRISGFSSNWKLSYFSAASMEATLETDDVIAGENQLLFCNGSRPVVDGDAYMAIGVRMRAADAVTWKTETQINTRSGFCPQRATGRYMRARIRIPAGTSWTKADGLELHTQPAGET